MQHFGPLLAQALVYNVGGNGARSELEKVADPLKKLIISQVRAKLWLESALFHENFPNDKVSSNEKRVFLQKIIKLVFT